MPPATGRTSPVRPVRRWAAAAARRHCARLDTVRAAAVTPIGSVRRTVARSVCGGPRHSTAWATLRTTAGPTPPGPTPPTRHRRAPPPARERRGAGCTGGAGVRTSPNAPGAPCARTTAPTATPGTTSRTTTPAARLPLERGRPGRRLRRPADALPRARALERRRPDPQGAPLRPDRPRGQPRRGRQGVLVVPRRHAHPLLDAPGATTTRSGRSRTPSWCRTRRAGGDDPEYELRRHRRLRRRPLLGRHRRVRQGRARRPAACASPSTNRGPTSAPSARAADAVVPQHLVLGLPRPTRCRGSAPWRGDRVRRRARRARLGAAS